MSFPFLSPTNIGDLPFSSNGPQDVSLHLFELAAVRRADGNAVVNPTISLYVWIEDYFLGVPTQYTTASRSVHRFDDSHNPWAAIHAARGTAVKAPTKQLTAPHTKSLFHGSAGAERDTTGPIARITSTIGRLSEVLMQVPAFEPFAAVGTFALSIGHQLAAVLGWSRPETAPEVTYMMPRQSGFFSVTAGRDPVVKITVDPLNEVPLQDPRVPAPPWDELQLAAFTSRWGWVSKSTWATTDSVNTSPFARVVTPLLSNLVSTGVYLPTPLALATLGFHAWRGSLEFRVIIPATPYHRGKLYFYHAPNQVSSGSVTNLTTNTSGCLVDVSRTIDMVFRIGYAQSTPFISDAGTSPFLVSHSATLATSALCNGLFSCVIMEPLQSPAADTLDIILLVRAGPDFELADPTVVGFSQYTTASSSVTTASAEPSQVGDYQVCDLTTVRPEDSMAASVYGERILSLRTVMKRYEATLVAQMSAETSPSTTFTGHTMHFPLYPVPNIAAPFAGSGPFLTTSSYAILDTHMSAYSAPFMGLRGSVKHKFLPLMTDSTANSATQGAGFSSNLLVQLASLGTNILVGPTELAQESLITGASHFVPAFVHGGDGAEFIRVGVGGALCAEGTFQQGSGSLFAPVAIPSASANIAGGPLVTVLADDRYYESGIRLVDFVSAGEDFRPIQWVGTRKLSGPQAIPAWSPAATS
jgi:hypothetical protein